MRATCERGARDAHLPNYFLQHCVAIIIRWIQGRAPWTLSWARKNGLQMLHTMVPERHIVMWETLWELGNWIKWKSKILPEYALCLVKFVSILKRCNHGSGCEILQRMWEFGVFYVNNQCLPWEPREGELCWSFIFSLAFTSPLMFIFFFKSKKWDLYIDRHSFSSALWKQSLNPEYFVCFMKVVSLAGDWRGSVWEDAAGGPAGDAEATNHFKKDLRKFR